MCQHLQDESGQASAQSVQETIDNLLHESEQVVDDDFKRQQEGAQRTDQGVEDAERGSWCATHVSPTWKSPNLDALV